MGLGSGAGSWWGLHQGMWLQALCWARCRLCFHLFTQLVLTAAALPLRTQADQQSLARVKEVWSEYLKKHPEYAAQVRG